MKNASATPEWAVITVSVVLSVPIMIFVMIICAHVPLALGWGVEG